MRSEVCLNNLILALHAWSFKKEDWKPKVVLSQFFWLARSLNKIVQHYSLQPFRDKHCASRQRWLNIDYPVIFHYICLPYLLLIFLVLILNFAYLWGYSIFKIEESNKLLYTVCTWINTNYIALSHHMRTLLIPLKEDYC